MVQNCIMGQIYLIKDIKTLKRQLQSIFRDRVRARVRDRIL